jgi:hypothetical protein
MGDVIGTDVKVTSVRADGLVAGRWWSAGWVDVVW